MTVLDRDLIELESSRYVKSQWRIASSGVGFQPAILRNGRARIESRRHGGGKDQNIESREFFVFSVPSYLRVKSLEPKGARTESQRHLRIQQAAVIH